MESSAKIERLLENLLAEMSEHTRLLEAIHFQLEQNL